MGENMESYLFKSKVIMLLILSTFFITIANTKLKAEDNSIHINVNPSRAKKGQIVKIKLILPEEDAHLQRRVKAVLLKPSVGSFKLKLIQKQNKPEEYLGEFFLNDNAKEGLYAIHAWTGNPNKPFAVGKASFLLGNIVADFFYPGIIDEKQSDLDISLYLQDFKKIGGNFLIAHGLIGKNKAYFPSKICKSDIHAESCKDIIELILKHCDQKGYALLLSVSWDLTRNSSSKDRMGEIKAIMKELYTLYKHHPSFVGFYSYLEGSGTYFVTFIREFSDYVKTLNPGLLSGCAPYVDDPMLAGYMSIIESLDIIIYQGMVMASYRPDNRKKYHIRRVKDFCSLGIGAKWLQNKIALTHVELFGYLENRISKKHSTTNYKNIYSQILSAATVAGSDGIAFFNYSSNIYANTKKFPQIKKSRQAVLDGKKAFDLIRHKVSNKPNNLTFYLPHSDWVIERWFNYYLPGLDAFRSLGIPVDILTYAPPLDEDYPYWPNHPNKAILPLILKNKRVLIFPNISGFKRTDSDWIKSFVEKGGVVIAFGPQIPMARATSYERKELFGVEEIGTKIHSSIIVKQALGNRIPYGYKHKLPDIKLPLWKPFKSKVIAIFEDKSPAILVNLYGKGTVVTIALSAENCSKQIPELIRDAIDFAKKTYNIKRVVDIIGTNENVDIAKKETDDGFRVAIINHNPYKLQITLKPLNTFKNSTFEWYDLTSNKKLNVSKYKKSLKLQVPGYDFICIEFKNIKL